MLRLSIRRASPPSISYHDTRLGKSSEKKRRARGKQALSPARTEQRTETSILQVPTPVIATSIVILVAAIYAGVASHDFINYDDPGYVTRNPIVQRGLTAEGIRWAFTSARPYYWQPLTWISHMVDCSLWGLRAGPHLLVNVALHALSSALLFVILLRMTGALWRSAFVAAFWAAHPLRVESVAWVAERKDVLSTLLFLATIATYVWYVRRKSATRFAAVVGVFIAALMAKPMVVTLPAALLLLDIWPLRRTDGWRRLLLEKATLLIPAALVLAATFVGQSTAIGAVPLRLRMANAIVAYARYLGKTLWPSSLAIVYPYREHVPAIEVIAAAVLLIGMSVLAFYERRSRPYLAVGWLWYLVTLVPVIGIVQAGPQAMADRFTYIPSIGLSFAIVWTVADAVIDAWARHGAATAGCLALLVLSAFSFHQVQFWSDAEAVFAHAVAVTDDNVLARLNLAEALVTKGRIAEAMPHYDEALRVSKGAPVPLVEIGTALIRQGRYADAIAPLEHAVRLAPRLAAAQENLGVALLHSGRAREALPHLEQALAISDSSRANDIRLAIGGAKSELDRIDEAIADFNEVLRRDPRSAAGHNELANAYSRGGKEVEAEREYREAIRLDPRLYDAHMNLAALLSRLGRNDEALAEIEVAARIDSSSPEPLVYRALVLANMNRRTEAAEAAATALRTHAKTANELFTKAVRLPPGENNLRDFIRAMGGR